MAGIVPSFGNSKRALSTRKTVHIVLDGAAYHRSEMVRNAAKVLNIELHYLPHTAQT